MSNMNGTHVQDLTNNIRLSVSFSEIPSVGYMDYNNGGSADLTATVQDIHSMRLEMASLYKRGRAAYESMDFREKFFRINSIDVNMGMDSRIPSYSFLISLWDVTMTIPSPGECVDAFCFVFGKAALVEDIQSLIDFSKEVGWRFFRGYDLLFFEKNLVNEFYQMLEFYPIVKKDLKKQGVEFSDAD